MTRIILIAALVLTVSMSSIAQETDPCNQAVELATRDYDAGLFKEAEERIYKCLNSGEPTAEQEKLALITLGMISFSNRQNEEARSRLRSVLEKEPDLELATDLYQPGFLDLVEEVRFSLYGPRPEITISATEKAVAAGITNPRVEVEDGQVKISYDLTEAAAGPITLYILARKEEDSAMMIVDNVRGDLERPSPGSGKSIFWNPVDEVPRYQLVLDVRDSNEAVAAPIPGRHRDGLWFAIGAGPASASGSYINTLGDPKTKQIAGSGAHLGAGVMLSRKTLIAVNMVSWATQRQSRDISIAQLGLYGRYYPWTNANWFTGLGAGLGFVSRPRLPINPDLQEQLRSGGLGIQFGVGVDVKLWRNWYLTPAIRWVAVYTTRKTADGTEIENPGFAQLIISLSHF